MSQIAPQRNIHDIQVVPCAANFPKTLEIIGRERLGERTKKALEPLVPFLDRPSRHHGLSLSDNKVQIRFIDWV
jgi:hypothetical protein